MTDTPGPTQLTQADGVTEETPGEAGDPAGVQQTWELVPSFCLLGAAAGEASEFQVPRNPT